MPHPFLILKQPEAIKADAKTLPEQLLDGPRKPHHFYINRTVKILSDLVRVGVGVVFHFKYNQKKGITVAGLVGEKAFAKVGQATELSRAFFGIDD